MLDKAYSPMTIRFFILQAHYRSTVDFSNEALQAAEKGFKRLMTAVKTLNKIMVSDTSTVDISAIENKCYEALNDDLNSPIVLSHLFDNVKKINSIADGKEKISAKDLDKLKNIYRTFVFDILGFIDENDDSTSNILEKSIDLLLNLRLEAKANKDFATSDKIRDELKSIGIIVKDMKDGFDWEIE